MPLRRQYVDTIAKSNRTNADCGAENFYDMLKTQAEPCNPPGAFRGNVPPIPGLENIRSLSVVVDTPDEKKDDGEEGG